MVTVGHPKTTSNIKVYNTIKHNYSKHWPNIFEIKSVTIEHSKSVAKL